MTDYLVTDTELDAVADAINVKISGTAQLVFPTGFVSAIQSIPAGGGEMYDAVIKCTNKNGFTNNSADYTWLVGSFDDLVTKFKAGEHLTALAYCKTESYDDEEDYYTWDMQNLYLINMSMSGGDWGYDTFSLRFLDFGRGTKRYSLYISRNDDPDMPLSYIYQYA